MMTRGEKRPYVSTTCLTDASYRETLDRYETAGIDRVELGYCPDHSTDLDTVVEDYPFQFVAHNYFRPVDDEFVLNLASQDRDIRTRSIEYVKDGIEFCHRHGIPSYTVHAGFRVDPTVSLEFTADTVPPAAECLETFVDSLRTLLPYATDHGVDLAIENNVVADRHVISGDPVVLLADPSEFEILFDQIEVGVLLDTGHLNVAAETLGFQRDAFLATVEPYIDSLHLHTNDGTTDAHEPVTRDSWTFEIWDHFDVQATVEAGFERVANLRAHLDTFQ